MVTTINRRDLVRPSYRHGFAHGPWESAGKLDWDGLVGLWEPSLGPSGSVLRDISGFGSHGDFTNMAPSSDWVIDGERGYVIDFDGTNDRIECGNALALQVGVGTISAWIRTSGAGVSFRGIIVKANAYGIFLGGSPCADNELAFYDWNTGTNRCSGSASLADNLWHKVSLTFDSGVTNGSTLSLDGVSISSNTMTVSAQTSELAIAAETARDEEAFNGFVIDCRVYNKKLTPSQILAMYQDPEGIVRLLRRRPGFDQLVATANPKGPLGHPLRGPLAGPI